MDLTSPARALTFSTTGSFEMLFTPDSVLSPGKGMVLSSPVQKYVADSDDPTVASVSREGTLPLMKPTYPSRESATTDGHFSIENISSSLCY
jgi:hypothetical protein